jgi:aquaporin Z
MSKYNIKTIKIETNIGGSLSGTVDNNTFQPIVQMTDSCKDSTFQYKVKSKNDKESKNGEKAQKKKYKLYQKFIAELMGTTMMVYHCCGAAVFNKGVLYVGVLSSSFSILFLIYCFINISGAHFNPALSLPLYMKGFITLKELIAYIIAQLIGAFLGCCFIALSRKGRFEELNATKIQEYLIHVNGGMNIDAWCYISCIFSEIFGTFMLDFFIFCISEENSKIGNTIGLAFGGILTALIFTGSNISGSSFNPVRSLAPAVLQAISGGDTDPLKQIWIYVIGPLAGGILSFYAWKIFDK